MGLYVFSQNIAPYSVANIDNNNFFLAQALNLLPVQVQFGYNTSNQITQMTVSGSNISLVYSYVYSGSNLTQISMTDLQSNTSRTITYTYGSNGLISGYTVV